MSVERACCCVLNWYVMVTAAGENGGDIPLRYGGTVKCRGKYVALSNNYLVSVCLCSVLWHSAL